MSNDFGTNLQMNKQFDNAFFSKVELSKAFIFGYVYMMSLHSGLLLCHGMSVGIPIHHASSSINNSNRLCYI